MTTPVEQIHYRRLNTELSLRISHRAKSQQLPFSEPSAAVRRFDTVIRILAGIVWNTRYFLAMRKPIASEFVSGQSVR
ncbi:MAG: hypothetical protein ACI8PT_004914 [Gammaproteobacteria bacterium]|jgi:hypothetical protein